MSIQLSTIFLTLGCAIGLLVMILELVYEYKKTEKEPKIENEEKEYFFGETIREFIAAFRKEK